MKTLTLPDLGEGLEDAEIVTWHVGVGDRVVADQPLVSVETAKALVEIPSPWSGRIADLKAQVGDIVKTGAALVEYEETGTRHPDTGTVVGELPKAEPPHVPGNTGSGPPSAMPAVLASPAVRKLARDKGIELSTLTGSGPGGAIIRPDLEKAAISSPRKGFEPLRRVRRAMALNMARSAREVPGSTVTEEVLVDHWRDTPDATRRLVSSIIAGCKAAPALNAWFDGERLERRLFSDVHLGVAINGPDGLFVPVLHNAERLTPEDIRCQVETLKRDVAARTIRPEKLAGATISLSNFGMLGGLHASLAIVPPQVAILGAGRIFEGVRPRDGDIQISRILPLSLTFDHRVVTGAEAVTFLNAVVAALSHE